MTIIGSKNSVNPSTFVHTANRKMGGQFTAPSTFTASFMGIYISSFSGGSENIRLGIYDESGGQPNNLIAQTDTIPDRNVTTISSWHFSDLQTPVELTGSTNYWLVVICDSDVSPAYQSGSGTFRDNADTFSDGFSDPFGSSSSNTGTMVIYAASSDETRLNGISTGTGIEGGGVGESSGGRKWGVWDSNTGVQAWYDLDAATPVQIGSTQSTTTVTGSATSIRSIDAKMDSNNVIHVVAATEGGAATRDLAYNTISNIDSSPAWGTWETIVAAYNQTITSPNDVRISIDIDENDDPHVAFTDFLKVHGTTYPQTYYTEKTGASWSTPESLDTDGNQNYRHPHIVATSSTAAYLTKKRNTTMYEQNRTSSTWGSDSAMTSSPSTNTSSQFAHNAIDGSANEYCVVEASNTIYEAVNGTFSSTGGTGAVPSLTFPSGIHIDGDDNRRILYAHNSSDNVEWFENDGGWSNLSGYFDDHMLFSGLGGTPAIVVGWQYRNLNNTTSIDILLISNNVVYWKEWVIAAAEDIQQAFVEHVRLNPVYRM